MELFGPCFADCLFLRHQWVCSKNTAAEWPCVPVGGIRATNMCLASVALMQQVRNTGLEATAPMRARTTTNAPNKADWPLPSVLFNLQNVIEKWLGVTMTTDWWEASRAFISDAKQTCAVVRDAACVCFHFKFNWMCLTIWNWAALEGSEIQLKAPWSTFVAQRKKYLALTAKKFVSRC